VSASARVSLGYLSEVERGQKEASSELLAAICSALNTPLSQVLREVSDNFALAELQSEPVFAGVVEPAIEVPELERTAAQDNEGGEQVAVAHVTSGSLDRRVAHRVAAGQVAGGQIPAGAGQRVPAGSRQLPARSLRTAPVAAGHLAAGHHGAGQVRSGIAVPGSLPISASLSVSGPEFDEVSRSVRDITTMVPV
jgi:transcriptional regulator with XRE-family HTH domain